MLDVVLLCMVARLGPIAVPPFQYHLWYTDISGWNGPSEHAEEKKRVFMSVGIGFALRFRRNEVGDMVGEKIFCIEISQI